MLGGGCRSQVQGEESLAWCHFWPTGCGVARADAKEPRKKKRERESPREGEERRRRIKCYVCFKLKRGVLARCQVPWLHCVDVLTSAAHQGTLHCP